MSVTSTEYAKKVKTPLIRVKITTFADGQDPGVDIVGNDVYVDVMSCHINYGLDQSCTTCSLEILQPTDVDGSEIEIKPMNRVEIRQGWNIEETMRVTFFGFIDSVEATNPPHTLKLECRDIMKLAENNYYIYSNRKVYSATADESELDAYGQPMGGQNITDRQVQEILADFLTESGIPESKHFLDFEVYPAEGALIIGNNATAVFVYESAADAMQRICDLIGYRLWADKAGNVQAREVRAIASEEVAYTYSSAVQTYSGNGVWITEEEGNLIECSITMDDDLRNWVEVFGYNDEVISVVYGDSDYVPNPPTYRRTEIRSSLLDTPELTAAVAARVYSDLNRLRYTATAHIEGDPRLELTQTVGINDTYATGGLDFQYFLYDFSSDYKPGEWTMDLTLVGGAGDNMEGSSPIDNRSPVAMFSYSVEREFISGQDMYLTDVWVDASSSYDPDGNEDTLTYEWNATGFSICSGINHHFIISGNSTSLDVTLTVTDAGTVPLQSTYNQNIQFTTESGMALRTIYVATEPYDIYVTANGGISWKHTQLY